MQIKYTDRLLMDLILYKQIAVAAAFKGQGVLQSCLGKISVIDKKGAIDLVTEADTGSEAAIIETIRKAFPDHTVLAEESGLSQRQADYMWIIDPLDGTTNFTHQLGLFAISIALAVKQEVVVGVVLSPLTGELFTAIKGRGTELNNRPVTVSDTKTVAESLLVTGFPYNTKDILNSVMNRFANCLKASQGLRRLGSAAMDLCYVACGRFDGFWEQNLKPWDTAAGKLIASEAGAVITDFANEPFTIDKTEILATNGNIHREMLELLN